MDILGEILVLLLAAPAIAFFVLSIFTFSWILGVFAYIKTKDMISGIKKLHASHDECRK